MWTSCRAGAEYNLALECQFMDLEAYTSFHVSTIQDLKKGHILQSNGTPTM